MSNHFFVNSVVEGNQDVDMGVSLFGKDMDTLGLLRKTWGMAQHFCLVAFFQFMKARPLYLLVNQSLL